MAANITARGTPEMGPGENSLPSQQETQVTVAEVQIEARGSIRRHFPCENVTTSAMIDATG